MKEHGKNSLSYLTYSDDFLFFNGEWGGYIPYKKYFKTAVVLGDPIVSGKSLLDSVREFKNTLSSQNIHICFFLNTEQTVQALLEEGYRGFLVGYEAVVDLDKFTLSGKKGWSIRSSINYTQKHDMSVEEYCFKKKRNFKIENDIQLITKEWIKIKKMSELGFAFGRVDFNNFSDARYFICRYNGKIVGFITYFPIFGLQSYYLDLSRRGLDAPRGTMDLLFVKSFEILKREGVKKVYIGYSPVLYSIDNYLGSRLFKCFKPFLEIFYPTKSEFFFKNKYATDWQPNYFFYFPRISIRMLFALVHSIYEGGLASIIINKIKHF